MVKFSFSDLSTKKKKKKKKKMHNTMDSAKFGGILNNSEFTKSLLSNIWTCAVQFQIHL